MTTTAFHAPAGLPLLRRGVGDTPADGGCLLQVASRLRDGRSWTDAPPWLHPILARAAMRINDQVPNGYRPMLGPLAADLAGLAHRDHRNSREVSVGLAVWAALRVLPPDDPASARLVAALDAAEGMDHRAGEWAVAAIRGGGETCLGLWAVAAEHACHTPTCHPVGDTLRLVGEATAMAVAEAAKLAHPGRSRAALLARYEAQREFLIALIGTYRELTEPTGADTRRWGAVCDLVGVTS